MKRTKQIENLIKHVNEYLKNNHINDMSDPVFLVICDALIDNKIYHGFNFYTKDGRLSGGKNTDYIQIY
jgi:hypothetical protein